MAALVSSFPSQSSTMLSQSRPSSSSGILQPSSQAQLQPQYSPNSSHGFGMTSSPYRTPLAPYAFTSTPALNTSNNLQRPQAAVRTSSAPNAPASQQDGKRSRYPAPASIATESSSSSSDSSMGALPGITKDDPASISTADTTARTGRPTSTIDTPAPKLAIPNVSPVKSSPDRYRRPAARRADASGSAASGQSSTPVCGHTASASEPKLQGYQQVSQNPSFQDHVKPNGQKIGSVDDMVLNKHTKEDLAAKRYRRRSVHTIEPGDYDNLPANLSNQAFQQGPAPGAGIENSHQHPLRSFPTNNLRSGSSHGRTGSTESLISSRSNHSRSNSGTKREGSGSTAPNVPTAAAAAEPSSSKADPARLVNIPPRSSSDAAKRIVTPSPLSKPMTMSPDLLVSKDSFASAVNAALQPPAKPGNAQVATSGKANTTSPAAQHLAALGGKDGKKSKSSRLRRAFTFGSAAELRRSSVENSYHAGEATDRSKLRKERFENAQDAEQARIAQQQEAGGIGENIYSGQGNFFTGSTDNLSISSTASSASIMIRKMGKSMKKSTRSLTGLFRPKSVIGVPAADSAISTSEAQVALVNVEAEREKVNVNASPHGQVGGGTGFPKLERNSIDAAIAAAPATPHVHGRVGSSSTDTINSRKSIVGGERERAEALNAVKKGILKRTGTGSGSGNSSPVVRPSDNKVSNYTLPPIPHVNDTPNSSAPSTPKDDQQRRNDSVNLSDEDYFMAAVRFRGDLRSTPGTPQGKRNVTFNLQLNNHDTWPSGEYDRRGEIATCNRLTPMLAQQIKEELNTFKMEMEVHDSSKIYTHFF